MSDNKAKRGEPDRSLINLSEPYEVSYWTKALGLSEQRLKEVVARVGNSADKVREHLKK